MTIGFICVPTEFFSVYSVYSVYNVYSVYSVYRVYNDRWEEIIEGSEMVWNEWTVPESDDPDKNCIFQLPNEDRQKLINNRCDVLSCPLCEITSERKRFMLRGVCLDSLVDSYYVMDGPSEFLGYIQTTITYSVKSSR